MASGDRRPSWGSERLPNRYGRLGHCHGFQAPAKLTSGCSMQALHAIHLLLMQNPARPKVDKGRQAGKRKLPEDTTFGSTPTSGQHSLKDGERRSLADSGQSASLNGHPRRLTSYRPRMPAHLLSWPRKGSPSTDVGTDTDASRCDLPRGRLGRWQRLPAPCLNRRDQTVRDPATARQADLPASPCARSETMARCR